MSTGSIMSASKTIFKILDNSAIRQSFYADGDLVEGLAVKLTGNGLVAPATPGDEQIGVVEVGAKDGEQAAIIVSYKADALVVITGGAATAGQKVCHVGTVDANGVPNVVNATVGQYATGVVISGGAQDTEVRIGILATPELIA